MSTSSNKRYSVARTSACNRCRTARARCSRDRPECARCRETKSVCVYERDVPDPLTSRSEVTTLLTAYFTHVYPVQAMSFVHRAQLFRQLEQGQAPPILVKALCGLAARYLPGADQSHLEGGTQAAIWMQEVRVALMVDTNRFSTAKLAATLCVLQHELNCGRTISAWMFVALAARMALGLGLNVESSHPWIEQEQRRRLMWSTYCADSFCASGWSEYSLLSNVPLRIYVPSDEMSFLLGQETPGRFLDDVIDSPAGANLLTRWIWLTKLRDDLLSYVRRISDHTIKPWESHSRFVEVVRRLRHWRDTLPSSMELTADNMFARQATNELDALIALHMCFESVHTTLYRFTLPNFTETRADLLLEAPRDWTEQIRLAAYTHARAVCRVLELAERHFTDHVPTSILFNLYIFNSLLVQIQYQALNGTGDPSGFPLMAQVIGKMITHFFVNRRLLRDILSIFARHGYHVYSPWGDRLGSTSGSRTPNEVAGLLSGYPAPPARPLAEPFDIDSLISGSSLDTLASLSDLWQPMLQPEVQAGPTFDFDDLSALAGTWTAAADFTWNDASTAPP